MQTAGSRLSRHVSKRRDKLLLGMSTVAEVEDDVKAAFALTRASRAALKVSAEEVREGMATHTFGAVVSQSVATQKHWRADRRMQHVSKHGCRGGGGGVLDMSTKRACVHWRMSAAQHVRSGGQGERLLSGSALLKRLHCSTDGCRLVPAKMHVSGNMASH